MGFFIHQKKENFYLKKNFIMKIGFVFTNFNNSKVTIDAVRSIKFDNNLDKGFIVIVDNNSDQKEIDLLDTIKNEYPNVFIIYNDINVGYFNGLNYGIKYLRNNYNDIEYILVGNNDLLFPINFIDLIERNLDKFKKNAVISPNIITLDGEYQNPHVINKISKFRQIVYNVYFSNYFFAIVIKKLAEITKKFTSRKDHEQHRIGRNIFSGHGACYILGPLFFKYFDILWSPSFLMGEELFLSKQLASKNLQIYYEPSIIVNHQYHAAINRVPNKKIWKMSRASYKIYKKYVKY